MNEINSQWQKHLQDKKKIDPPPAPDSTPKKIGNLLNWNNAETQRLEEELMTTKLREMETLAELKELRLKVLIFICFLLPFYHNLKFKDIRCSISIEPLNLQ